MARSDRGQPPRLPPWLSFALAGALGLLWGWTVLAWTDVVVAAAIGGAVVAVIVRRALSRFTAR